MKLADVGKAALVIAGLSVAVLVFVETAPNFIIGHVPDYPAPEPPEDRTGANKDETLSFPLPKGEKVTASTYPTVCEKPHEKDYADLCQQWRMAEAARQQLVWLERQFRATFLEIGGLLASLFFTGWAALAASKAAKSSEESGRALVALERAYLFEAIRGPEMGILNRHLHPHDIEGMREDQKCPAVTFQFINYGKTPAIISEVTGNIEIVPVWGDPTYPTRLLSQEAIISSSTGSREFRLSLLVPIDERMRRAFFENQLILRVCARARYKDVFGNPYETRFNWVFRSLGESWQPEDVAGKEWNKRT